MQITVLKTHQSNGEWVHSGTTTEVDETRAKELIRNGLATEVSDESKIVRSVSGTRAARTPSNKKAADPANKAAGEGDSAPSEPVVLPAAAIAETALAGAVPVATQAAAE